MAQYIYINNVGNKYFFKDREMNIHHREDGPAVEWANGDKSWWLNGELHREDGPAIEWADGSKWWYLNGERLSEAEFIKRTAKEVVLTMDEIAAKLGIDVNKLKITGKPLI